MVTAGQFEVGRFKVLDLLGSGGFASVYRAEDPDLGREVALKVLHPHLAAKAAIVTRFRAEARAYARLHHPNIVTIYEVGYTDDGRTYLVMPIVEGVSLAQSLAREPLPQVERSVAIVAQLGSALDYLHRAQLVHRDVKPSNVMIGRDDVVTLMDLGIARDLDSQANLTLTGEVVGSPAYMAPEQLDGGTVGRAADVYALGVVTYELLAGRPPFTGSASEVIYKQLSQRPPPLTEFNPNVNPALAQVVEQALEKKPEGRPASAGAFAESLAACLGAATPFRELGGAASAGLVGGRKSGSAGSTAGAGLWRRPERLHVLGSLIVVLLLAATVLFAGGLLRRGAATFWPRGSPVPAHALASPSPPAVEALPKAISLMSDDSASRSREDEVRQDLETIFARFDKEYSFTPKRAMTIRLNSDEPTARRAMLASGYSPTTVDSLFQRQFGFDMSSRSGGLVTFVFLPTRPDLVGTLSEIVAVYGMRSAGGVDKPDAYPYWFIRGFQLYARTQFSGSGSTLQTAISDEKSGTAPALATIAADADARKFLNGPTGGPNARLDGRGQAAVAFLAEKYGNGAIVRLLRGNEYGTLQQFDALLQGITGMTADAFNGAVGDWLRQMPAPF